MLSRCACSSAAFIGKVSRCAVREKKRWKQDGSAWSNCQRLAGV